jgi:hypothetical protein
LGGEWGITANEKCGTEGVEKKKRIGKKIQKRNEHPL